MEIQDFRDLVKRQEINRLINNKIQEMKSAIGKYNGDHLPNEIKKNMVNVVDGIKEIAEKINNLFMGLGFTATDDVTYLKFLCSIIPDYILILDFENLKPLLPEEIGAIAEFQSKSTSIETMREALAQDAFLRRSAQEITLEQTKMQINEIEDGLIQDAYKTLVETSLIKFNNELTKEN